MTRTLPLVPKETTYTWAHVEDVAQGHFLAMEKGKPGEKYFICSPVHSVIDALEIARELTWIQPPNWQASPGLLKASATVVGVIGRVYPLPESYTYESPRVAAGVAYLGDNSKAKQELVYDPRPLKVGLEETRNMR